MTNTLKLSYAVCCAALLLAAPGCTRSPQAREAEFLKRGDAQMAKKDYARAILEFRNATQAMPRDAEPYYRLGLAYLPSCDWSNAVKAFKQATERNPKHAGAILKLAEIMTASGNKKLIGEASTKLEKLLDASPDNAEAIDTLATAELHLGNTEEAVKRLEDSLQKSPGRLESSVILAQVKLRQRDLTGAEEVLKKARTSAPQSVPAALALGQFYLISRHPEKAEEEIREALQLEPQNPAALLALGDIQIAAKQIKEAGETYARLAALPDKTYRPIHALFLYQTGQKEASLKELQELARKDPTDRAIRSRMVSLEVEMDKTREAQDVLAAALKRNSGDADALLQRGELYLNWGKLTEAEGDLQKVLHLRPDSAEAHFALSGVFRAEKRQNLENDELDAALQLKPTLLTARLTLAKNFIAANQPNSALDLLDKAPAAQRGAAELAIQRNWALYASGNTAEARKLLDRQLARKRIPELVLQSAILKMGQHDYLGARKDAEEALKASPEDVRGARLIVQSFVGQNDRSKAQERLAEIAAARPKSAPLQNLLGEWYVGAGRMDDARKAFEAAKAADSNWRAADLALADIDRGQGRTEAARQRLAGMVAADPANIPALLRLAEIEEAAGDRASAMTRYRSVLAADGSNLFALNNLAYDLVLNDPDKALKLAQQAGELAPDNASVQDTLAWVYHRKGIESTAITYLKTAVAKEPTPRRQFHLAMCYLKADQPELGQKTLLMALAKDPNLSKTEQGW
jgi:tetratricopeptide (TPR) repeat protein